MDPGASQLLALVIISLVDRPRDIARPTARRALVSGNHVTQPLTSLQSGWQLWKRLNVPPTSRNAANTRHVRACGASSRGPQSHPHD